MGQNPLFEFIRYKAKVGDSCDAFSASNSIVAAMDKLQPLGVGLRTSNGLDHDADSLNLKKRNIPTRTSGWAPFQLFFPSAIASHSARRMCCVPCRRSPQKTRLSVLTPIKANSGRASLRNTKTRSARRGSRECGFSLVELMIVIGLIMTIAAISITPFARAREAARYVKAIGDIDALETDIFTFNGSNGYLPDSLADVGRADLRDPWGNFYVYTNYGTAAKQNLIRKDHFLHPLNSDYDLFSPGADGQWKAPVTAAQSQDDIIRATDGNYVGLASQY
jgi:general secretion pathway protein G